MQQGWTVEQGDHGPRMVLQGAWSPSAAGAVRDGGIKQIELNYAKGWTGDDYAFLRELPELEALEITDWNATDVSAVNDLTALRHLKVFTYCKTELRFDRFPRLEECSLEWRPRARSLFQHTGVKRLFVNHLPGRDLKDLSRMHSLERLSLASPKIEALAGVEGLTRLSFLGLYWARRLATLVGVGALAALTHLEVNDCRKIRDIGPIAELRELRQLHLCNDGEIESFAPLRGLRKLEVVLFYESTNVLDGDLGVLKTLPKLADVAFMDRPHYSHRRSELPERPVAGG